MNREDFSLLYNADDPGTFKSTRWNRFYTQDLCFLSKYANDDALPAKRKILYGFPNSQNRPVIIHVGLQLPLIRADKKNRWNFTKANWEQFSNEEDRTILRIPLVISNYSRFVGLLTSGSQEMYSTRSQRSIRARLEQRKSNFIRQIQNHGKHGHRKTITRIA